MFDIINFFCSLIGAMIAGVFGLYLLVIVLDVIGDISPNLLAAVVLFFILYCIKKFFDNI